MTVAGQILFLILVVANLATLVKLGRPWTYQDRAVSGVLWLTAWSAVLFDGAFLFAIVAKVSNFWLELALVTALSLRAIASVWLLWMVLQPKEPK